MGEEEGPGLGRRTSTVVGGRAVLVGGRDSYDGDRLVGSDVGASPSVSAALWRGRRRSRVQGR